MEATKLETTTPVIVIDDFLPEDRASAVLAECASLEPVYQPARVLDKVNASIVNNDIRRNDVVYLDSVFGGNEKRSKILQYVLREGLFGEEAQKAWAEGNTGFQLINQCTRAESVLSRYGKCDFYGFHRDYSFNRAHRLVTAVYYCNTVPERFTGGRLLFKGGDLVEPRHNRLVVFNSGAYHSVERVSLPEDAPFGDGRFSVNMWLGFNS